MTELIGLYSCSDSDTCNRILTCFITGGRCVMKMDHHCPWINNCVGHYNHGYFTSFLFFAVCGSIHSCILLIITVYKVLSSVNRFVIFLSQILLSKDNL